MQTHKTQWQVSLSNGETFREGKGRFSEREGENSPWLKLLEYLAENRLSITSLALVTEDGRTFNLPSSGKNPNFAPFRNAEKPTRYELRRYMAREANVKRKADRLELQEDLQISDWHTSIVAIYNDYELQLWVDEIHPENCWTLVVKI